MATLAGCFAMSHGPQLMLGPDHWNLLRNRESERLSEKPELEKETDEVRWNKWNRCMEAIGLLRGRLQAARPDVIVLVGDDQHENILDDNTPPFTIFTGNGAEASTSLKYLKQPWSENRTRYQTDSDLAMGLVCSLMENGFDPAYSKATRYDGGLGHAFARVLKFLLPDPSCRIVPIMVNTYYPPAPSSKRCVQFGRALRHAISTYPGVQRVTIVGSGGLSHTKIDEVLDRQFLEFLKRNDVSAMAAMPSAIFVEGTSEILNWIVTAAAADRPGEVIDYLPLYRTSTGVGCAMGFAHWELN